jgi:putative ABC transport system permease protein
VLAALCGAALILPMFRFMLSLGQRYASPVSVWFWADSRQQLSGLSLALMALIARAISQCRRLPMVEFQRVLVWLDGRLAADVYISAAMTRRHMKSGRGSRAARGRAVLPGARADTQLAGAPIEVLGARSATYRDNWPLLQSTEDAWVKLRPAMALVSEQLAQRLHSVGDRIKVSASGETDTRRGRHLCRLR